MCRIVYIDMIFGCASWRTPASSYEIIYESYAALFYCAVEVKAHAYSRVGHVDRICEKYIEEEAYSTYGTLLFCCSFSHENLTSLERVPAP